MDIESVIPRPVADPAEQWRALYEEHRRTVFGVCYALLGNVADADNATQEVFLKVRRHLGDLDGVRDERAWLQRIAVRTSQDQRKSFWRRLFTGRAAMPPDLASHPSAHAELEASEEQVRLRAAIAKLSKQQRTAVALKYYRDMDIAAIANAMGVAQGSVKVHLHRGVANLRKLLEEPR
jgi:RNA polymerase sigma-70 factor (ECF subfamily)